VISYLTKLDLLDPKEAEDWRKKLFV